MNPLTGRIGLQPVLALQGGISIRICIVGAGAIGGFIGARLAAVEPATVSVLARGRTLDALRQHGWRLQLADDRVTAPAHAASNAADLGLQDLVVIAVKGPALVDVARQLAPLLGPDTIVMPAMNGVPWWFCRGIPPFGDEPLRSLDPHGDIARAIPYERVIGCVVYASASVPEPGLVLHHQGHRLVIGEPFGGTSARVQRIADRLSAAGFQVTCSPDVRYEVWFKLWGNMTTNPISAITGATGDRILADPLVREFSTRVMIEAAAIGERIGCHVTQSPADRHAITAKLGAFRTSMLQDAEAGRPLELDALVTAVYEIGERVGVPAPSIRALLGLTRLYGRVHGLYPEG